MTTIDDDAHGRDGHAPSKAGRAGRGATRILAAGADDELGQQQIRTATVRTSIAFFREKFGEWLVPMLQDVMAGNPVPSFVGTG